MFRVFLKAKVGLTLRDMEKRESVSVSGSSI